MYIYIYACIYIYIHILIERERERVAWADKATYNFGIFEGYLMVSSEGD